MKLEALRECRPPWPRQIITLIMPTVKMLSLGCERLPTPLIIKLEEKTCENCESDAIEDGCSFMWIGVFFCDFQ